MCNGPTPAAAKARPPRTSSMPARSRKPCCWARSPSAAARNARLGCRRAEEYELGRGQRPADEAVSARLGSKVGVKGRCPSELVFRPADRPLEQVVRDPLHALVGAVGPGPVRPGQRVARRRGQALGPEDRRGVEDEVALGPGVDRGGPVLRACCRRPRRSLRRRPPGRGCRGGSPWYSQPIRPGMRSPFFMPVPAKIQCSGLAQIQSPPPLTGSTLRPPMRKPSSGPCSGNGPCSFSRPTAYSFSAP